MGVETVSDRKQHPGYDYKTVDLSEETTEAKSPLYKVAEVANFYSELGWRVVGIIPPSEVQVHTFVRIHEGGLLLERVKRNPHSQINGTEEFKKWMEWEKTFGSIFDGR